MTIATHPRDTDLLVPLPAQSEAWNPCTVRRTYKNTDEATWFDLKPTEPLDPDPAWAGLFEVPPEASSHHVAWLHTGGEVREIRRGTPGR